MRKSFVQDVHPISAVEPKPLRLTGLERATAPRYKVSPGLNAGAAAVTKCRKAWTAKLNKTSRRKKILPSESTSIATSMHFASTPGRYSR